MLHLTSTVILFSMIADSINKTRQMNKCYNSRGMDKMRDTTIMTKVAQKDKVVELRSRVER